MFSASASVSVSVIRASSIRPALLPTVQCPNTFLSTRCITAAHFHNDRTHEELLQHAHENQRPRHASQFSDVRLTRRLQPFPIAWIRRVCKLGPAERKNDEAESRALQDPHPRTQAQLSEALTRSQNIHQLLRAINSQVLSHQDGLHLLSISTALVKALGKLETPSKALTAFTIIIARLHHVGIDPDSTLLIFGTQCAARAGSFEAVARYLDIAASHGHLVHTRQACHLLRILHCCFFDCDEEIKHSWDGRRRKQQVSRILTGWHCDGVRRPGEERQPCLFMALPLATISLWEQYISLLRRVGGKDVVFSEWLSLKRSLPGLMFPDKHNNKTAGSAGIGDLGQIAGYFAKSLVEADDAERAWQIIHDSGITVGAVSNPTWSLLLDHPQYIRSWQPEMAKKVLEKYEESIRKIEATMGIRWLGGADGYHVTTRESADESGGPDELEDGLGCVEIHAKAGASKGKRMSKSRPQRQVKPESEGKTAKQRSF